MSEIDSESRSPERPGGSSELSPERSLPSGPPRAAIDPVETIAVDGRARTYTLHRPDRAPSRAALLIALHGRRLSTKELRMITRFDGLADRSGIVVVYPEGYRRSWNDGSGNTPAQRDGMDDVAFILALIESLVVSEAIDPDRVAVAGLSNGGCMAHRLGLELSRQIAAIASVAGYMPRPCAAVEPTHGVSVLSVHGSEDRVVRCDGGNPRGLWPRLLRSGLGRREVLSIPEGLARWVEFDGSRTVEKLADRAATPEDPTWVERQRHSGGVGGTRVESWIVHGGGHTWPGGPRLIGLGRTTSHFDASEEIWNFVTTNTHPAFARCRPGAEA